MNKFISNILEESEESIDDFFKPKNLKSRQEKRLKQLEIECQKKYHMSIDELKSIYFSIFDQMKKAERIRAKKNFDIEEAMKVHFIPTTISGAINGGFYWAQAPEGHNYWQKIFSKYNK